MHIVCTLQIPVRWMAPESITDRKYSTASDVWSFGVLCWEVHSYGAKPYADLTVEGAVNAVLRGTRLARPDDCPLPTCVMLCVVVVLGLLLPLLLMSACLISALRDSRVWFMHAWMHACLLC